MHTTTNYFLATLIWIFPWWGTDCSPKFKQICRYSATVMPGFLLSVAQKSPGLDTHLITIFTILQMYPKRYSWLYPDLCQNGPDLQPSTPILCDGGLKVHYIFVENRIFNPLPTFLSSLSELSLFPDLLKTSECFAKVWSKSMFLKKIWSFS